MPQRTPVVRDGNLVPRDGHEESSIAVGTPEWYGWLASATAFSFVGATGRFSARRTHPKRGGWYWTAYCTQAGIVCRAYLGKPEALTLDRLEEVASLLALKGPGGQGQSSSAAPGTSQVSDVAAKEGVATERSRTNDLSEAVLRDSILAVKLSPPPMRSDFVARPHLFDQLTVGTECILTLVSAPAGFGKTTLVGQWCRHSKRPVAWLSLDRSENDRARFWGCFIAAIQTLYPQVGKQAIDLLHSSQHIDVKTWLGVLANDLATLPNPFSLVLDDYHLVDSQTVHAELAILLDALPWQMHLIIVTRTDPPLPLARLRVRRQLIELRGEDLAFTSGETEAFLNGVMGMGLTAKQAAVLRERTEGWVAALQLAALTSGRFKDADTLITTFGGDDRYVMDYLMEEVLRGQPEAVQRFLLRTSILDRLSGSLCDAVTGETGSEEMLERLDRANMFILGLDSQRRWYRYHLLFAEFLRSCLERSEPGVTSELHRRASRWYISNGLLFEAISHALAAGDVEQAAAFIERAAPSMLARREIRILLDFLQALPDEVVRARPRLCLERAKLLTFAGHAASARQWLEYAEAALSTSDSKGLAGRKDGASSECTYIRDEIVHLRSALNIGRGDLLLSRIMLHSSSGETRNESMMHGLAARLLNLDRQLNERFEGMTNTAISMVDAIVGAQSAPDAITSLALLGTLCVLANQHHDAEFVLRQSLKIAADAGLESTPIVAEAYYGLVCVAYEWNDLGAAEGYCLKALELSHQSGFSTLATLVNVHLAMVRWAQGKTEESFKVLEEAQQLAQEQNSAAALGINVRRVELWLRQGNIEEASRWAESAGQSIDGELIYPRWVNLVALALVRVSEGEHVMARDLVERALNAGERTGLTLFTIHALVVRALCAEAASDMEEAMSSLARALSLAEPAGLIRSFLDFGHPLASLLTRFVRSRQRSSLPSPRVSLDYAKKLLTAFSEEGLVASERTSLLTMAKECIPPLELPSEMLTEREVEVLQCLLTGASNDEIAERLVVAKSTVKSHIASIYSKLEIHNRAQLLRRAGLRESPSYQR